MNTSYPTLNYNLGEEVDMLRDAVYQFAQQEIAPRAESIDRDNEFPQDLWQKMGDLSDERPPEFLSTHPAPENRQATLQAMVPAMLEVNPQRQMAEVTPITIVR